jgi:hypothetical protein
MDFSSASVSSNADVQQSKEHVLNLARDAWRLHHEELISKYGSVADRVSTRKRQFRWRIAGEIAWLRNTVVEDARRIVNLVAGGGSIPLSTLIKNRTLPSTIMQMNNGEKIHRLRKLPTNLRLQFLKLHHQHHGDMELIIAALDAWLVELNALIWEMAIMKI